MTIEAEVQALTVATTDLLEAVNIGKQTLDASVLAAEQAAAIAVQGADASQVALSSASSRSGKDANGIYTTVEYRRANNSLLRRSVLSGGVPPEYTTRTETVFDVDGVTVLETLVFILTYASGELVSEDLA